MNNISLKNIFTIIVIFSVVIPFFMFSIVVYNWKKAHDDEIKAQVEKSIEIEKLLIEQKVNEVNTSLSYLAASRIVLDYTLLPDELRKFTEPRIQSRLIIARKKIDLDVSWEIQEMGKTIFRLGNVNKNSPNVLKFQTPIVRDFQGLPRDGAIEKGILKASVDFDKLIKEQKYLKRVIFEEGSIFFELKNLQRTEQTEDFLMIVIFVLMLITSMIISILILKKLVLVPVISRINRLRSEYNIEINEPYFKNEILLLDKYLEIFLETVSEKIRLEQIIDVSKQVAHDIRSPLAALEVVTSDIEQLPIDSRDITIHAIKRIQEIANNLSQEGNQNKKIVSFPFVLMLNVIEEKKLEFKDIDFKFLFKDKTTRLFAIELIESEFSRLFSNLLNNAIEASNFRGCVLIEISNESNNFYLKIFDSGKGFPKEILDFPIEKGRSLGKVNGQGLGLFHANNYIKSINGKLKLYNSNCGVVEIQLPFDENFNLYTNRIDISDYKNVVLIDDDKSILELWDRLLKKYRNSHQIQKCYSENQIEEAFENLDSNSVVFIDFDLNLDNNGLYYVEKYSSQNIFFVTSEYENDSILEFCKQHSIQIIPKKILPYLKVD